MTTAVLEFAQCFTELSCADPDSAGRGVIPCLPGQGPRERVSPAGGTLLQEPCQVLCLFPSGSFGGEGVARAVGRGHSFPSSASQGHTHVAVGYWSQLVSQERYIVAYFIQISSVLPRFCPPPMPASRPGSHVTPGPLWAVAVSQTCLVFGDLGPFRENWAGVLESVPQLGGARCVVGFGRKPWRTSCD